MKKNFILILFSMCVSSGLWAQNEVTPIGINEGTSSTIVYSIDGLQHAEDADLIKTELLELNYVSSVTFDPIKSWIEVITGKPSYESKIFETILSCHRVLGYSIKVELIEIR